MVVAPSLTKTTAECSNELMVPSPLCAVQQVDGFRSNEIGLDDPTPQPERFAIPLLAFQQQGNSRIKRLVEQLPDALELMARALSAGLGLSDAFRLVAEEMPMPIAAEFGRVQEEVRFGRDYREAFGKLTGVAVR